MTWVRLDDGFAQHPKVVNLSDRAFRVHVAALCYCNANRTDGLLLDGAVRVVGGTRRLADELLRAGLWEPSPNGAGGFVVHDYLDYQPSRETIDQRREAKVRAGAAGGRARAAKRGARQEG